MLRIIMDGANVNVLTGTAKDNSTGKIDKCAVIHVQDPQSGIQVEMTWVGPGLKNIADQLQAAVSGLVIGKPGTMGTGAGPGGMQV